MNLFNFLKEQSACLKTDEAKKIIRAYNRIAKVLVEYEVLYHNAWIKSVEVATTCKIFFKLYYKSITL